MSEVDFDFAMRQLRQSLDALRHEALNDHADVLKRLGALEERLTELAEANARNRAASRAVSEAVREEGDPSA